MECVMYNYMKSPLSTLYPKAIDFYSVSSCTQFLSYRDIHYTYTIQSQYNIDIHYTYTIYIYNTVTIQYRYTLYIYNIHIQYNIDIHYTYTIQYR